MPADKASEVRAPGKARQRSRALGLGRTKAYALAREQQFPCRVIRIGDTYRVPTAGLLELLGLTPDEPHRSPADQRG